MEIYNKFVNKCYSELAFISILFLFFFQLIGDFLESIYALNLIEVELNENVLALLFLLTPIVLLFFKKGFPDKAFIILGEIIVFCRVLEPFLIVELKMIVTGIGLGCFMIFFPVYIQKRVKGNYEKNGKILGIGLGIAILSSIALRALGSSIDLSTFSWFMWIGWIMAFFFALMVPNLSKVIENDEFIEKPLEKRSKPGSKWKILGLSIGMINIITLVYFAFTSPTVIARWTESNYILVLTLLVLSNAAFLILIIYNPSIMRKLKSWILLLWNIIFIGALVCTILFNTIIFTFVSSYPFYAPPYNILNEIIMIIMLILSPIIFIDFILVSQELFRSKPSTRKLGGSFFISSGLFLFMILFAVFTIVWDYIPLVGDLFRDMIWLVYLILGIFIFFPVFLVSKNLRESIELKIPVIRNKLKSAIIILMLGFSSIIGVIILELPVDPSPSGATLTISSYNIQQGFDDNANKNFEGQYEVLKALNPDIIGLQESDTSRISSGNSDIVRFINNRLKLYSYYGPKTVTGTYGIALLSKYPILNPKTFYMESKGEQTATIWAQIVVGSTTFNIFVTHLGNYEDPAEDTSQIVQQENILSITTGLTNVILMGDFNFEPNTEQYNITVAQLYDCWDVSVGKTIGDVPDGWETRLPLERIDHIFVSGELNTSISSITYTGGNAADHPCVFASISGPF